jgi:hypothetical protein
VAEYECYRCILRACGVLNHKVHANLIQLLRLPFDVSPLTPLRCMHAVVESRPDLPLSSVVDESTMALLVRQHGILFTHGIPRSVAIEFTF